MRGARANGAGAGWRGWAALAATGVLAAALWLRAPGVPYLAAAATATL
ncbi:MAG: hypothetical protein AVDCRST_MAG11-857, partial [uncultured Gemmatimonadaceae bacterium]